MQEVIRPKASEHRINSSNNFELVYIRHQYFRRSSYNPSKEEMFPYTHIIKKLTSQTYFFYSNLFQMVGFDKEDLFSIGTIHLVSFLGLFSMEMMPEKYHNYASTFGLTHKDPPNEQDIVNKNRANFTIFLKQRMKELVRICRQKVRNIKGIPFDEFQAFHGSNKPPADLQNLLENYEEYKFNKMDATAFKTIRKKSRSYGKIAFKYKKVWYIAIPLRYKKLALNDLSGAGIDPYDNMHNMNPEQIVTKLEDEMTLNRKIEEFRSNSNSEKEKILKQFIEKNQHNNLFFEEVATAKKTLISLG